MKTSVPPSTVRISSPATLFKACLLTATLGLIAIQPAKAAVIPYANDFSGNGSNVALPNQNVGTNTSWTVTGGSYVFNTTNTSYAAATASIDFTNMGTSPFLMETQFSVSSIGTPNNNGETIGFGFFGKDASFSGTDSASAYYLADWQVGNISSPGTLRITAVGKTFTAASTIVDNNPSVANSAVTLNTTYTMRLSGSYTGSTLNMTFSLLDSNNIVLGTVTASDASPIAGTYFGYRNRIGMSGGTFNAAFDNFSVTPVPEPGTVALLGLSAGATLLMLRRRRSA